MGLNSASCSIIEITGAVHIDGPWMMSTLDLHLMTLRVEYQGRQKNATIRQGWHGLFTFFFFLQVYQFRLKIEVNIALENE